jgi:hypothetical protein
MMATVSAADFIFLSSVNGRLDGGSRSVVGGGISARREDHRALASPAAKEQHRLRTGNLCEEASVRVEDAIYRCALCEAVLHVPVNTMPEIALISEPDQPTTRTIRIRGQEIHRCEIYPH